MPCVSCSRRMCDDNGSCVCVSFAADNMAGIEIAKGSPGKLTRDCHSLEVRTMAEPKVISECGGFTYYA